MPTATEQKPRLSPLQGKVVIPPPKKSWSRLKEDLENLVPGSPVRVEVQDGEEVEGIRMRLLHIAQKLGVTIRTWKDKESGELRMVRVEEEMEKGERKKGRERKKK